MKELIQKQSLDDFCESILTIPEFDLQKNYNIKTIVFDLGGVYFTNGSALAIEKIRNICDIKNYDLLKHIFSNEANSDGRLIRLGLININEFEQRVISKLNIPKTKKHHIKHLWFGSYVPNYKMEEILKQLFDCGSYRLIAFSGNVRERISYLNKKYDFLKYFNKTLFSYDYQLNKRDINFYYELLNHIKCQPSQVILIDDCKYVLEKAKSLGFNVIQYSYTEQFVEKLRKYNVKINIDL